MSDLPPSVLPPPPTESPTRSRVVPAVAVGTTSALTFQFGGSAAWSIGFGLVAIATPFVSSFYFSSYRQSASSAAFEPCFVAGSSAEASASPST